MLLREPQPLSHDLPEQLLALPADLHARAAEIAAAHGAYVLPETTPEDPGVFSFIDTLPAEEDIVFSVLGDRQWDVASLIEKKDRLAQFPIALGALASRATISTTTGCWSVLEENIWRDEKGYAFTWQPETYGFQVNRAGDFRGIQMHRMAYNMKLRAQGLPDLNQYQHLDHVCRWTGCCNIDHLEIVSRSKNNKLRDEARRFEAAIIAGQIILGPLGKTELDYRLLGSNTEFTNLVITTVTGPYRLVIVDKDPLMFRGEPESCALIESVAPPAPKKYERPSRAKKPKVIEETADSPEGQRLLFDNTEYDGRRVNRGKLYKQWQKTGNI